MTTMREGTWAGEVCLASNATYLAASHFGLGGKCGMFY